MLDLGLREEMLEHGGGALESFLCESGGLQQPVEVVFSTNQVQCLNLLVQLYQQRGQHHKAAQVGALSQIKLRLSVHLTVTFRTYPWRELHLQKTANESVSVERQRLPLARMHGRRMRTC